MGCDTYVGALEQAAPYMAKVQGLENTLGGELAMGDDADPEYRWVPLLSSGHKEGQELREAWRSMKEEAKEAAEFLGEEVEGVLAKPVEGAGSDSAGLTRKAIVEDV